MRLRWMIRGTFRLVETFHTGTFQPGITFPSGHLSPLIRSHPFPHVHRPRPSQPGVTLRHYPIRSSGLTLRAIRDPITVPITTLHASSQRAPLRALRHAREPGLSPLLLTGRCSNSRSHRRCAPTRTGLRRFTACYRLLRRRLLRRRLLSLYLLRCCPSGSCTLPSGSLRTFTPRSAHIISHNKPLS